jgi:hypothetical protein
MPEPTTAEPVEWRGFTIPGGRDSEWNPEIHGVEVHDDEGDSEGVAEGDCAVISWRPGEYVFSCGSGGASIDVRVPEPVVATRPSQDVLRGFHELLKFVYDE